MRRTFLIALFGTLFAFSLVALSGTSSADHVGQTLTIDGMDVYLGLKQVDTLRQNPVHYPNHQPEKFLSGKHVYHVMLALFDASSGERITDAVVDASVVPLAFSGPKKELHPTVVAGALTYCSYFRISPRDTYVIRAEIRRPETAHVTRARFVLERQTE